MSPQAVALKFQVGARTLAQIDRRLIRIPLSLEDALAVVRPVLPHLPEDADGYVLTSLPEAALAPTGEARLDDLGLLAVMRQRYVRYHVDLAAGEAAWLAKQSANTRSGIGRKARKIAARNGGTLDIRAYRTPDELTVFHPLARIVSATTYQEKLLGAGLPEDPARLASLAAADRLRAWLLFIGDTPVAYLCCTAEGETLRYDFVGHDPAYNALSPGAVLQVEALRQLFAERRFARFDFTEGEGQHKRQFSTGGIACVDMLLLRPTWANRAAVTALQTFDTAMDAAKRAAAHPALARLAKRVRR